MKISARQADGFVKSPDPKVRAVLVFGPDSGLARERAETLARGVVDDLSDPFRVAELDPAAVAKDAAMLNDEAAAIALTGGRRVIRLKDAGDRLAGVMKTFLADPPGDALVIVEGGDLSASSKLRKVFEAAGLGAALPCYRDEGRDLERFVGAALADQGLRASSDAVGLLAELLGGDRLLTRSEIAKLAVYMGDDKDVRVEDVLAVVADSSYLTFETIARAVMAGDTMALGRGLDRAFAERESPVAVLGAVRREMQRLALFVALVSENGSPDAALKAMRLDPRRHFRIVEPLRGAARRWRPDDVAMALTWLAEADLHCKSTGFPDVTICREVLMRMTSGLKETHVFA
ncbi:MAG: DNA polymerase III subunit delta [Pseudomonadota bacterium]